MRYACHSTETTRRRVEGPSRRAVESARCQTVMVRGKQNATIDPEYETRLKLAINDLTNGTYKTILAAARAHGVRPLHKQDVACRVG